MTQTYYRYTNSLNPMSDWGHAMFAANQYKVENYGDHGWIISDSDGISIHNLKEQIISKFTEWQKENAWDTWYEIAYFVNEITPEQFFEAFDPRDIVDSAEAYDNDFYVTWLWDNILEPNDIYTIITSDGAVTFDKDIINKLAN